VVAALEAIEAVQLTVWTDRELLWDAIAIALRRGCSVYDSLFQPQLQPHASDEQPS
jgi:predicted nucleic acid-binding protein